MTMTIRGCCCYSPRSLPRHSWRTSLTSWTPRDASRVEQAASRSERFARDRLGNDA